MDYALRDLFHELADVPREQRDRILAERQIPVDLRAELESLLAYDEAALDDQSLTRRVAGVAGMALGEHGVPLSGFCGPYRLVRLLGSGGMGAVYLAERRDGEIQQNVAIKLLRAGADRRPAWRERFLRERQLLANLNHPSIARLLDAGHTTDGLPYLVMEFVDGVAIDEYAATLDLRGRLSLFLHVCDGVAHAHQRLTVHRDLKPSNILVDSSGQPKLLDFGIAKLTDEVPADDTQTADRLLTPQYASPEQLRGEARTTATDIYSLGAVLHKLLTGRAPREKATGTRPALPRDVDHILRKALREEPDERYASVDAFAGDIRAFLESRPVQVRAGDSLYRARRFFRRFWIPLAGAAVLIAGLATGIWAVNRARLAADRRFNDVRQLANKLFDIEREVRRLPGGTHVRQLIVDTSLQYLRRLASDAKGDPGLALEVGTAFMRVGRVQGVGITANLGQADQAEQNLRVAEGLIRSALSELPDNRTAFLRAAQIAHDRMVLAQQHHPPAEALGLAYRSEEWLSKYLDTGPVDPAEKEQVVLAGINVANWYFREDQPERALRLIRRTIDVAKATNQPSQVGAAHIVIARGLRIAGDLEGALTAIGEGVKLLEPPNVADAEAGRLRTFRLAVATQGDLLGEDGAVSLGRPAEATALYERSFQIAQKLVKLDPRDAEARLALSGDGIRLAGALRLTNPRRAVEISDEVLREIANLRNNPRAQRDELKILALSTYPLRQSGRAAEARRRVELAFARLEELKLYPAGRVELRSEPDWVLRAAADLEAGSGNLRQAIELYARLLKGIAASAPKPESILADAKALSNILAASAALHRKAGEIQAATDLEHRRRELWRNWDSRLPNNAFVRRQLLESAAPQGNR